ncbi:MAG: PrsW family intramembrane metalloprotease [Candidatus Moranbacteria bacterium]|nr:PrsW family intramembrane metalloprotease [Candidatus Moranbacteria bacterium]
MIEFFQKDPQTLIYAILGGVIPALFWLWFWLKHEDKEEPEPLGLLAVSFILGGLMVFVAIWMEKISLSFINHDQGIKIILWATIEELLKFIGISLVIFGNKNVNQPIDYPVYFMTAALGFAAFENVLYLINPIETSGAMIGMFTGGLRFLGSTLLHAISSAMIGSALGLSFYIQRHRKTYLLIGIIFAITLHSIFNFFIMKGSDENFLSVFGFLWVVTIINILVFEKLKRMARYVTLPQ